MDTDGNIDSDNVEVELLCDNGFFLRLSVGPDGERVRVYQEPWVDSFKEPLSDENREFIRTHGKWCFFDVSTQFPFVSIIGKTIPRY